MAEYAPGHKGGFLGSFLEFGTMGLIGMYMRSRLDETPVFEEAESHDATQSSALGGTAPTVNEALIWGGHPARLSVQAASSRRAISA